MVNYLHPSNKYKSDAELEKMNKGLCPKCDNDTFKFEKNIFSFDGNYDFLVCTKCDDTLYTRQFVPRNIVR